MAKSPFLIFIAMLIARMYNACKSYLGNSPLRPDPSGTFSKFSLNFLINSAELREEKNKNGETNKIVCI